MCALNKYIETMLWIHSYVGYALLGFKKQVSCLKWKQEYVQYITKTAANQNDTEFKEVDYSFVVKSFLVY